MWSAHIAALQRELRDPRDGSSEAVLAHLTLLSLRAGPPPSPPKPAERGLLQPVAQAGEVVEAFGAHHAQDVVKADSADAL